VKSAKGDLAARSTDCGVAERMCVEAMSLRAQLGTIARTTCGMSECQFRLRHLIAMCSTSALFEAVAVQFSSGGPV